MSSSSLNIQIRTRLHVMSMERSKWMQFNPNVPVGMQTDTTGAQMCPKLVGAQPWTGRSCSICQAAAQSISGFVSDMG